MVRWKSSVTATALCHFLLDFPIQYLKVWKVSLIKEIQYSAVRGIWPLEEWAELAAGPTGCGEVARGGCLFPWNFSVTRWRVLTDVERRTRTKHDADSLLFYRLKIPQAKSHALHYTWGRKVMTMFLVLKMQIWVVAFRHSGLHLLHLMLRLLYLYSLFFL